MLAVWQSSLNPARALGLPAAGLAPGARADLVVLDANLSVTGVLRHGTWVVEPRGWQLAASFFSAKLNLLDGINRPINGFQLSGWHGERTAGRYSGIKKMK
jgi:cytosine/adenosine deaminase-related metal-dependent hydrolase